MKKVSTAVAKQRRNGSQQKLTIGLDLGDRNSWYCVLDEAGKVQLEQRVRTTAKALLEVPRLFVGAWYHLPSAIYSPAQEPPHGCGRLRAEPDPSFALALDRLWQKCKLPNQAPSQLGW